MKVGFIGLGIMGQPMAINLIKAGFDLHVYARNPQRAKPLRELGAAVHDSSASVAAASDIIIIMVADTPDVEDVLSGDQGVVEGARSGSLIIDMSTISPIATRDFAERLKEKNLYMLDAPVSGGEQGAINATLTIMVGGEKTQLEKAMPVFQAMGQRITHLGSHGAGQVCKACNQILAAQTIAAVGEAMLLARACDVEPGLVREALLGGFCDSRILEIHGQRMLDDNFAPGFKAHLHRKDLRIAMDTAKEKRLTLPGSQMVAQYMEELVNDNGGELDSSAIVKILEQKNRRSIQ